MLFVEQWLGYRDAAEAKREFAVLQAALRTMARLSAERQPTFAILGGGAPPDDLQIAALERARQGTDMQLDELGRALRNPRCRTCAPLLAQYDRVRATLTNARRELDASFRVDRGHGDVTDILLAFGHLVDAIPMLSSIADESATGVIRENADVQSYLMTVRLAALLREHAGLVASRFIPALVAHRPLTEREALDIAWTLGKIDQLRALIGPSIHGLPSSLQADYSNINQRYFKNGLTYIDSLRLSMATPGGAGISVIQFGDYYTPLLTAIDRFRDDTLALAEATIRTSLHTHAILLAGAGLLALALTGIVLLMAWRFREKIVRPFVEARRLVLAIASGDLAISVPRSGYRGEVKDLFGAVGVLKQNSVERLRLERERKRLIGELRTMAETDALTGLLNRRAFSDKATAMLKDQRQAAPYVALVMLDIDHFKQINDTYGHETGDRALVTLSALCRDTLRADDLLARVGGEEFAILLGVESPAQARELAERLRGRLHQETVSAVDGAEFGMTASFGIAIERRANAPELEALLRRADALLYRAKEHGRDRIEADDET
ncbi:GGDEF domain-containing protein [Dyella halodurans]|uniref:diguanylate cyclase n=1 Tax=Dyella halodurans TaxID=1920171 RepID=A0ABV9C221_9GAMM|nr:GGDEF domain-containing protein [Dyella halodurans]